MKSYFLAAALVLLSTVAIAQTPEPDITIKLPQSQWNIVLQALGELPLKTSFGLVQDIQAQAKSQIDQKAAPIPAAKSEKPKK